MKKFAIAILIIIVAAFAALKYAAHHSPDPHSLRHLTTGEVVGFADKNDTYAWLGIPFAQPPLGQLRWRAPQPPNAWSGVREALKPGSMCAQIAPFKLGSKLLTHGDEDCLYVNVWAPRSVSINKKLPVMVWIHGGANTLGGASVTAGNQLSGTQNVIVVALQYRLGLFGWMSHPALRNTAVTPADTTSNFAELDMIAALQWVQNNIAEFGGDPNNVTIFGQSAGGFDVFALLASPPAKNLFHRAIVQSGGLGTVPQERAENYLDDAVPGAENSAHEFVNKVLIADGRATDRVQAKALQEKMSDSELLDYLRAKSPKQLLSVVAGRGLLGYSIPTNIRDGQVLPRASLLETFADPANYNSVPVIIGSNRDEFKFFMWSDERFTDKRFGFIPRLKDAEEYDRFTRYFSDQWQATGVNEPAAVLAHSQPEKVFAYRFDWADQPTIAGVDMGKLFGAAHGIEVMFIFGSEAVNGTMGLFAKTNDETAKTDLTATMMSYWATFAKTGAPGNGGNTNQPEWQPWQDANPQKMLFDSPSHGGVRMSKETLTIADLKARLRSDEKIQSPRERCELYAQLFLLGFSTDFWSTDEYNTLGCANYPAHAFKSIR